jgi:Ca2+-binding RTX toxin-like protein
VRSSRWGIVIVLLVMIWSLPWGEEPTSQARGTCLGASVTLLGTDGDDDMTGTNGPDVIDGAGGDDVIKGLGGNDRLCGGGGDDSIDGGPGDDRCDGGGGEGDTAADCETTKNLP